MGGARCAAAASSAKFAVCDIRNLGPLPLSSLSGRACDLLCIGGCRPDRPLRVATVATRLTFVNLA